VKLVVGLGNPGAPYVGTRHNVGFEVVNLVAARQRLSWDAGRGPAEASEVRWRRADGDVLLARPETFMNLSGRAVQGLCHFYKVAVVPDLLVVCDDVNLPLGRLRVRASGSEGGHNGLRSVAESLGSIDYARLRVGVGRGDVRRDLADHVLARFDAEEMRGVEDAIARAADAVETWVSEGLARVMSTFNRAEENT
jgi:PTH1 family peptidyl-tRNA hydrolase